MQTVSRTSFTTVKTEGAILPADLLQRVADGREVEGLRPEDYHLAANERLSEAISRSWNRLLGVWQGFDQGRHRLPESDRGTTLTRQRWLLILFQELGYGRLPYVGSLTIQESDSAPDHESRSTNHESRVTNHELRYPISHQWGHTPLHLITLRQSLDRRDPGTKRSPHSTLQEYLNRADEALWGFLSNGLRLRLLRDNASLTRAAYVEFDLEAMMQGEIYADFALLWLICHQSRVETAADAPPSDCWLEKWSQEAAKQGARALEALRHGVQQAIEALGQGFLSHRGNTDLKAHLKSGELSTQDYYRQLLRLVYRLIFLFVAEDRDLLLVPDAPAEARQRYTAHYSAQRVRTLARGRRGGPHPDLYRSLRRVWYLLREGYAPLGLPGLGGYLFSHRSTPALDAADIANRDLLEAIRALAFTVERKVRRPVDYRNLGAEELGSVYESLLELHPQINADAGTFALKVAAGSERKTTGSYYTPSSLIQCLLDSALEPVVEDCLRQAKKGTRIGADTTQMNADEEKNQPRSAADQRDQRSILEQTILNIKIVDPACGSGHFLIAAAHRLARHLAQVRTEDEEPAPAELRSALREVVRRCIHGVDINPMAVELCKVALWMETLDPGKPLSFLDRNIQCGNSLIGATPALLQRGIPDDAFKPITGDDKVYCREWRKRNKEQRESGQLSLFAPDLQPWDRLGNLAAAMSELDAVGDDTLAGVKRQQELYEQLVRSSDYRFGQLLADAWCAAFVWIKTDDFAYPITWEIMHQIELNPFNLSKWMEEEIGRLQGQYQFFHWHLAFPHVFRPAQTRVPTDVIGWEGGFDVVLGNPPWERIKLQEKEWFASRDPAIAAAPNKAARQKLIGALQEENPALYSDFLNAKRQAEGESHLARDTDHYPLCGRVDVNAYALFAELARQVQGPAGRVGIIVPSGIATDDTTKYYFRDLMHGSALVSLYDFENREAIFPGVHRSYKFCLLTLTGTAKPAPAAEFVFFAHQVTDLGGPERHFTLDAADIALLNPNTRTCPIFRSRRDAELTKAVYRRVPVLVAEGPPEVNPWGISFMRMFDMSNDSGLFRTREQLEAEGWQLRGNSFLRRGEVYLPLYEAKMVHHFDHRWATYEELDTREVRLAEKQDPAFQALPRYWVPQGEVDGRLEDHDLGWLIGFRDIARSTDERTSIFSFLPRVAVDHTTPLAFLGNPTATGSSLACCMSSLVFDYSARQKIGGTHPTFGYLRQLPVLPIDVFLQTCRWCGDAPPIMLSSWLLPRTLELTFTAWDLEPLARDSGYHGPPFRWDEERRFLLRCELDAAFFHLYGVERDDVGYIMETFAIVKRKDEVAHDGEHRTKRVILEIYDEMQRATETGEPYPTRLDPPPADPRVAHPWDEGYLGPYRDPSTWWEGNRTQITADETLISADSKRDQRKPATDQRHQRSIPPQGSPTERRKRVTELGREGSEAAVQELVAALADPDDTVRWLAGAGLGTIGAAGQVQPTLLAFLKGHTEPVGRQEAVRLLGRVGDAGVRPVLEEIVGDAEEEETVRAAARTALAMLEE